MERRIKLPQKAYVSQCTIVRDCTISIAMLTFTCLVVVILLSEKLDSIPDTKHRENCHTVEEN